MASSQSGDSNGDSVDWILQCPICRREYGNTAVLNSHLRRSHGLSNVAAPPAIRIRRIRRIRQNSVTPINAQGGSGQFADVNSQLGETFDQSNDIGDSTDFHQEETGDLSPRIQSSDCIGTKDHPSALEIEVSDEVASFYKELGDAAVPLHPTARSPSPQIQDLHASCLNAIESCINRQLTLGEVRHEWELINAIESKISPDQQYVTKTFPTASSFAEYVRRYRCWMVKEEGWHKASIKMESGLNETGVFRSAKRLMLEEIEAAGGVETIEQFSVSTEAGQRVYTKQTDSQAMEEYEEEKRNCGREHAKIVGVDVYCDGTMLSGSGSQSAHTLRVRFANLPNRSTEWHEIGLAPILLPRDDRRPRKKGESRRERMELFQRFLFLALQDLVDISSAGTLVEGVILLPRIIIIVADQPQERGFVCLKAADSFRDCTHCEMISRLRSERKRKRRQSGRNTNVRVSKSHRVETSNTEESESACASYASASQRSGDSVMRSGLSSVDDSGHEGISSEQLRPECSNSRDVSRTVISQLVLALRKHSELPENIGSSFPTQLQQNARSYVESFSALPFPPALAAFHGLGTKPFRLYKSCSFDKLHAFDLGLLRMIPDLACERFEDRSRSGLPLSQTIQIANQRVIDLPRCTRLPRIALFRSESDELQSGITGRIRRDFAPFLWLFVIGLDKTVTPDNDDLVQASLCLAQIQGLMLGVNQPIQNAKRTREDIEHLQKLCFETGRKIVAALDVPVNTKIHRVMRHVSDHLLSFGCMRRGNTDNNEAQHKTTKKAYKATNHKIEMLAPQLLHARVMVEAFDDGGAEQVPNTNLGATSGYREAELLLTRNTLAKAARAQSQTHGHSNGGSQEFQETEESQEPNSVPIPAHFNHLISIIPNYLTPEEAEKFIAELTSITSHDRTWELKKSATIVAELPWAKEQPVRQTIFAGQNVYNVSDRRDTVEYTAHGETHCGIMQSIFKHARSSFMFVLVRRLVETEPQPGNTRIVTEFGHTRFKYAVNSTGNLQLDIVALSHVTRQVVIVPDVYDLVTRFGVKFRAAEFPQTLSMRRTARFFDIPYFKYTSFPEQV